jgi:hypothetical protein
MTPDAYQVLDDWGMPHPEIYDLETALGLPSSASPLYVRGRSGSSLSAFVPLQDLKRNAAHYRLLIERGDVVQIEKPVICIAGGCAVCSDQFTYIELVAGHLSGLLRERWCQVRLHLSRQDSLLERVPQAKMVQQTFTDTTTVPATRISDYVIERITRDIRQFVTQRDMPILYEFIVDQSLTLFFVDYKLYTKNVDFLPLFRNHRSDDEPAYFEIDSQPATQHPNGLASARISLQSHTRVAHVGNTAALSHFITYGLGVGFPH